MWARADATCADRGVFGAVFFRVEPYGVVQHMCPLGRFGPASLPQACHFQNLRPTFNGTSGAQSG